MAPQSNNDSFLARHRWWVWTAGIVVAVIFLASFMSRDDAVPVRAATATRTTIRSVVSTNGKVEPLHNFEAHAPVGTTLKSLLVKEGDHVKKGQLLVQLDDADARAQAAAAMSRIRSSQADLAALRNGGNQEEVLTIATDLVKARSERDAAQRNLDAMVRLQKQGAASAGEVTSAESGLQKAEADVKLLEQKQKDRYSAPEVARAAAQNAGAQAAYDAAEDVLSQLNVRAPFDGVVYSLPFRQGAYVNPGDLILQEADLSKVVVRAFVDEPDVGRLAPGDRIEVTWDASPGRIWEGSVSGIPAVIKLRGTRNVGETTCVVDNHDYKLLPNINVNVTIVTGEHHNVLTVPREAIRQDDTKTYVLQIDDQHELRRRDVQIALSNLTQVEVTGGIVDNTLVALNSTNSKPLYGGLNVKIVP